MAKQNVYVYGKGSSCKIRIKLDNNFLRRDVKNIHINRNNITLTDQNGNVLDIRHINCKTIYWIFVYKK